ARVLVIVRVQLVACLVRQITLFLRMIYPHPLAIFFFLFDDTATTEIYTLSLHDALPILGMSMRTPTTRSPARTRSRTVTPRSSRSEEHTSELQSRFDLVCRLLLEKKKKNVDSGRDPTADFD